MLDYRKGSKINSGGFGVVFYAFRPDEAEATFALKELSADATEDDKLRFVREVNIQAKLSHPNIVPVVSYDLEADSPVFVMPLARTSLESELPVLHRNVPRTIEVFRQILDGVEHAHSHDVVHRDLKPGNILFFDDGAGTEIVKISDFGLGKRLDYESVTVTSSSEAIGSAAYMPPEQFSKFKHVDKRGDIYSLGKILYHMFTNELPVHVDLRHADILSGYRFIIAKCLEYNPNARYQMISELRDEFLLLSSSRKKFETPVERAKQIVEAFLIDTGAKRESLILEFDELLGGHDNDEAVYSDVFVRMPDVMTRAYHERLKHRFNERVRRFDEFASGSLPFPFTSVVANFYGTVYEISDDDEIKRLIIARLLEMGHSHNRYHVRDVLAGILESIKNEAEALMARDILAKDCSATVWCAVACSEGGVLPIISEVFESCRKKLDAARPREPQ